MAEVDLERLVLPALLALLVLGAFLVLVTSGGTEESLAPLPAATTTATTAATTTPAPATGSSATPPRPVTAPSGRFVKVQQGDTMESIATAAAISVDRLAELNPSVDPDSLRVGQTLKLAR